MTAPQVVIDFAKTFSDYIVNPIIGVIFAAGLAYFLWGLMVFIFNAGNEGKRTEGKQHMLWGLVGMFIMMSVFTILRVGLNTFGVANSEIPEPIRGSL